MNLYYRNAYEKANLLNADKLHNLISTLDELKSENKVSDGCFIYKEYIPDEKGSKAFCGAHEAAIGKLGISAEKKYIREVNDNGKFPFVGPEKS